MPDLLFWLSLSEKGTAVLGHVKDNQRSPLLPNCWLQTFKWESAGTGRNVNTFYFPEYSWCWRPGSARLIMASLSDFSFGRHYQVIRGREGKFISSTAPTLHGQSLVKLINELASIWPGRQQEIVFLSPLRRDKSSGDISPWLVQHVTLSVPVK